MNYLYTEWGENPRQSSTPPEREDIDSCAEGYLEIIRFKDGKFERMTPIDADDAENWEVVPNASEPSERSNQTERSPDR